LEQLKNFWQDYRRYCLIGLGVLICLIGGWYLSAKNATTHRSVDFVDAQSETQQRSRKSATVSNKMVYVDVKGAVNHPGVYSVKSGLRVQDAITKAGGVAANADMNHVNMAKQVTDQQVVYVPVTGEVTTPMVGEAGGTEMTGSESSAAPIININSASKDDLMKITGVGDKKADLILQYRQEHGQFKTVEDLKNVSGFGDASVAKIKDQLAV